MKTRHVQEKYFHTGTSLLVFFFCKRFHKRLRPNSTKGQVIHGTSRIWQRTERMDFEETAYSERSPLPCFAHQHLLRVRTVKTSKWFSRKNKTRYARITSSLSKIRQQWRLKEQTTNCRKVHAVNIICSRFPTLPRLQSKDTPDTTSRRSTKKKENKL